MMKRLSGQETDEIGNDGFWEDVVKACEDYLKAGIKFSSVEDLWEISKERARYRYVIARRAEKAKRLGVTYEAVLAEERAELKKQRDRNIN